jgi:hypothetical protein
VPRLRDTVTALAAVGGLDRSYGQFGKRLWV